MATVNGIDKALVQKVRTALPSLNRPTDKTGMRAVVASMTSEISRALPTHLRNNAERYGRQLLTLWQNNRNLQACDVGSQLAALMTAAALGLDLAPQLGQCYVIPRKGKAVFQFG